MPLLFLLAGISARYALQKQSPGKWFGARTRKLLVPGTIGLLVFHWMVGYFNTAVAARMGAFDGVPPIGRYFMCAFSGIGPLWFIQLLWLLCIVLLIVRAIDSKDKIWNWCGKAGIVTIILLGYMMKTYTNLPPLAMYAILTVAVFTLSPVIYEIIRRIPVIRWCVFGEKKR